MSPGCNQATTSPPSRCTETGSAQTAQAQPLSSSPKVPLTDRSVSPSADPDPAVSPARSAAHLRDVTTRCAGLADAETWLCDPAACSED